MKLTVTEYPKALRDGAGDRAAARETGATS